MTGSESKMTISEFGQTTPMTCPTVDLKWLPNSEAER